MLDARVLTHQLSRRTILAASGLLAGGAAAVHPAHAQTAISIALDWYPNANHAGIYWAEDAGWFTDAGLEVTVRTPADPSSVLQTVAAGRDTFGISYQPDVLLARDQGVPVVAVASIVPRPLLGVMSLASSGIASPADLAGRTVGYPGIPAQEAFLRTMLAGQNLTLDDIELVNVEFNLLPALLSDQAAAVMGAYWTHETIVAEQQGYPVSLLKVDEWGVPLYDELVLVTSEDVIAKQADVVDHLIAAVRNGYAAAAANQPRALESLQAASPEIDLAVETKGLALLAEIWTSAGSNLGLLDSARWDAFAEWMVEQGLVREAPAASAALYEAALIESVATPGN